MAPLKWRSRLSEWLVLRGKSQLDLAIYLNVTEGQVSHVANSRRHFSMEKYKLTADFLHCTILDLVEWEIDKQRRANGESV